VVFVSRRRGNPPGSAAPESGVVGRDEKTTRLARHFAESPKYSVEGALTAAKQALRKAGR
jgi:hypothetical protein